MTSPTLREIGRDLGLWARYHWREERRMIAEMWWLTRIALATFVVCLLIAAVFAVYGIATGMDANDAPWPLPVAIIIGTGAMLVMMGSTG